jgi:negative regulator of sigma E activity
LNSNLRPNFAATFRRRRFLNFRNMKNETPDQNELRALRGLLSRLPDAPVPSNFTARVMQAVELAEARPSRKWNFPAWNWRALLPRFAVAAAVVAFAGFAFHQHELDKRRAEIAQSVVLVAQAQPLPNVEALKNFDAIQRMGQPAHADKELLALLQ